MKAFSTPQTLLIIVFAVLSSAPSAYAGASTLICAKIIASIRHPIKSWRSQLETNAWDHSLADRVNQLGENDIELYRLTTRIPGLDLRQAHLAIRKGRADVIIEHGYGDERIRVIPVSLQVDNSLKTATTLASISFLHEEMPSHELFLSGQNLRTMARIAFEFAASPVKLLLHPSKPGFRFTLDPSDKAYFERAVRGEVRALSEYGVESYVRGTAFGQPQKIYLTFPRRFGAGVALNVAAATAVAYFTVSPWSPWASYSVSLNKQVGPLIRAITYFPDKQHEVRVKEFEQAVASLKSGEILSPNLIPIGFSVFERRLQILKGLEGGKVSYHLLYIKPIEALMTTKESKVFEYFDDVLNDPELPTQIRFEILHAMLRYRKAAEVEQVVSRELKKIVQSQPHLISELAATFHGIFYRTWGTSPDPWSNDFRRLIIETALTLNGEDHVSVEKTKALKRITYPLQGRDPDLLGFRERIEEYVLKDHERNISPKSDLLQTMLNIRSRNFSKITEEVLTQIASSENPVLPSSMDDFYPIVGRAQGAGLDSLSAIESALKKAREVLPTAEGGRKFWLEVYISNLEHIARSLREAKVWGR